ncbi:retrovirus-related Pol polyprotein from transposon 412 [Trichonephila clavipes]|nr:retrovirus-related Pol polyprotein from transposon 412 [Trichonephila clavipes]
MIEELHRPLKSAIKCHATERWTEVLPIILLGLRASLKEDTLCTPAELVFGTTIRLPGEMFDSSKPDDDVVNFVSKLKSHMQSLHPKPPKHHGKRPVFIHPGLLEATHVFLRRDICKPAFFLNTEDLQLPQTKKETPATVEPNATASTPATVESDPTASTPTQPSTRSGRKVHLPTSSPFVKKQDFRFTEKNRRYESPGKFEYIRKDKKFPASTNYNKHYEAPVTKNESAQRYQDSAQKGYYNKNYEKHSNHNSSKHIYAQMNYSKSQKFKEPPKETCTLIVKEGLRTKDIFFGKVKITALIDSGSTVSLLRENSSRRIMDPTKLSKNKMLLTGIGEAQVTTIGSFEHEFKIDDENYSLTWHVVPTDKLKFEAVIGSDLLEQASISFTKEGVKFNKYENHAQLMQISAEILQEELDLRHVENRQIKKELEKLIQDYKPEKTASTDVTMRIILKDEEPVCQPPRRLAFTERQEVNKQIEEWLNEGIIRPSSAEYASPIVMVKKKDGSSRMCIDYRKLNQKLVKDKFPLPIIEDVLDTLQEAKVYSTLDLRNGFFHVDVDEDCRKYTSFIVPDGQFEFNKVPFGLSTSPGVFQRYVSSIFRDLTRKGIVISYLDDLVIPAKNEQEGLEKT